MKPFNQNLFHQPLTSIPTTYGLPQDLPSGHKTRGYRTRVLRQRLRSAQAVSMISAWALALVHRHPTCSRPRRLAKRLRRLQSPSDHQAQTPHATSSPQICRMPSGSSMTKSSNNYDPRSLPSTSDGARRSPLRFPASGAANWSLPSR
jgi:hypothetical protein